MASSVSPLARRSLNSAVLPRSACSSKAAMDSSSALICLTILPIRFNSRLFLLPKIFLAILANIPFQLFTALRALIIRNYPVGEPCHSAKLWTKQQHRLLSKPLPGQRFSSLAGGAPHKLLTATWDSQASIRTACDPVQWVGHKCSTAQHSNPNVRAG